eukprot:CAMPEP_0184202142 /NCGR_PEP_ID=MMETSP0976-20121227/8400_1 /TAXON_ID=483370 /ORGANISM="non described non described, Strain CCMP2097" /LENGTH=71 /DNA_ID=CAMNT_0026506683 /DNA_START=16 /DNA_END=227 /DNA_ORIENTATION=+
MSLSNVSASSEAHQGGGGSSAQAQAVVTASKSKLCDTLLGCAELTANSPVLFVGTADDGGVVPVSASQSRA